MKNNKGILLVLLGVLFIATPAFAQSSIEHPFSGMIKTGTTIKPAVPTDLLQVNAIEFPATDTPTTCSSGNYNLRADLSDTEIKVCQDGVVTVLGAGGAASGVAMSRIGASTFSTVQHMQDIFHSSGFTSGGLITDAGGATIDVAVGTGLIRATTPVTAEILYFDWPASTGLAITADTIRFIGVEYNAGTPQVTVRTSDDFNNETDFILGVVVNEGGTLHIADIPHRVGNHATSMILRSHETHGIERDNVTGGMIAGETGTRNITVSAGSLWDRLNEYATSALDTSVTGGFDTYSTGGQEATGATQWPNEQYDNAGTLTTLANNKWATLWFYTTLDDTVIMVYGTVEHSSAAAASAEMAPTVLPNRLQVLGLLVSQFVFQKTAATAEQITSLFDVAVTGALVSDHGNLTGLLDDDHTQYLLTDGTRALTGTLTVTDQTDGDSILAVLENSEPHAAASTNETAQLRFGFGGDLDVARIVVGKEDDYDPGAGENDSFMAFYTDRNGTATEAGRFTGAGRLGVNTETPNATLDVTGDSPGTVGGFSAGALQITSPTATINASAVITGHNSFGGNKQLWYLGSSSGSNDNITLRNRQNGSLDFATNDTTGITLSSGQVVTLANDLAVTEGGTGTGTFTDGGILLGSGTSAITALGVATNGQIPIGDGATDPVLATITGTANEITVTNGAGSITLDLPDLLFIGDTSNANMTAGGTWNQGGADNEIMAWKSSDVAHGVTLPGYETDTYGLIKKGDAAGGILQIVGLSDADAASASGIHLLPVSGQAADTTKTTAGIGILHIRSLIKSSTDAVAAGADSNIVTFANGSTTRFIFDAEGTGHADDVWGSFSDRRLKSNIALIPYGLDEVLALSPKIFDKHSGYIYSDKVDVSKRVIGAVNGMVMLEKRPGMESVKSRRRLGFIAQDVKALIPELVKDIDETKSFYSLAYGRFTPILWRAVQEQQAQIDLLVSRIEILEAAN